MSPTLYNLRPDVSFFGYWDLPLDEKFVSIPKKRILCFRPVRNYFGRPRTSQEMRQPDRLSVKYTNYMKRREGEVMQKVADFVIFVASDSYLTGIDSWLF